MLKRRDNWRHKEYGVRPPLKQRAKRTIPDPPRRRANINNDLIHSTLFDHKSG